MAAPDIAAQAAAGMTELAPISARRRRTDELMRGVLGAATVVALIPLVLVIYYLFHKGLAAWSRKFFTTDPNGNFLGYPGGIRSAILGTIEIVALATLISVPIGIGVALYLTEYGKDSRFANVVRYFVDVMTGVPSIVFGLFIYIVLVLGHVGGSVRRVEGVDRAVAADAADRRPRRRRSCCCSSPAACARPRSRSARRAGASSPASCSRPRSRVW